MDNDYLTARIGWLLSEAMSARLKDAVLGFLTSISIVAAPFLAAAWLVMLGISVYRLFWPGPRSEPPGIAGAWDILGPTWPLLLASLFFTALGFFCYRKLYRRKKAGTKIQLTGLAVAFLICSTPITHAANDWAPAKGPLITRWAKEVSPKNVHREYPRPQLVRKQWQNLNGLWQLAIVPKSAPRPDQFTLQILVPFPVESALSGVMKPVTENDRVWYRRSFTVPQTWRNNRVLLHFGAVDFETTVWVNGTQVGEHRGGYDAFSFDITDALRPGTENELVLSVWDPTDAGTQPRGKQIRRPHGIWYTSTSGIWQTVWLEPVNAAHISALEIVPDIDSSVVRIKASTPVPATDASVGIVVRDGRKIISQHGGAPGQSILLAVPKAKLWSPETPHLYSLFVTLKVGGQIVDQVESYFGMRKISLGKDPRGFTRVLLNNKPYFQLGPLDQGFWPDGLYTAPTDAALRFDIEMTKALGFNMARKHVKIEPDRWYYWCDKLGLLVWQDMPSGDKYIGGRDPDITRTPESALEFESELTALIQGRGNHPCIVMWVPYNEGWGQWDTARIVQHIKQLDPSRLVDNASGWSDRQVGDVNDMHRYPGPGCPSPETNRAAVLGEFGGLGLPVRGHTWQEERNWGYRSFTNSASLTDAYVDLLSKLFPLIGSNGLSAAVYTQTTDVEVEVNGLMTYDRALVKMDATKVRNANFAKFPPRPKIVEVLSGAVNGRPEWRYTTNAPPEGWTKPGFDTAQWQIGVAGFGTVQTPGAIVRTEWRSPDIWLRREFSLEKLPNGDLRLFLHHDEDAEVYLNGVLACTAPGYATDYAPFALSDEARTSLKREGNVLAIHCHQTAGGQYIDAGLIELQKPSK